MLYDLPGASTTAWTKNDLETAQIGVRATSLGVTGATDLIPGKLPIGFPGKLKPVSLKEDFNIAKMLTNEIDKANAQELVFLSLLDQGVGTLRSAVDFLGISTDSFIGKLLQGLDVAMSIAKTIQAFQAINSIASAASGNPLAILGAISGLGGGPLGSMQGTPSITINAVDAKSFGQMLSSPDNRRVFVQVLDDAGRKGK